MRFGRTLVDDALKTEDGKSFVVGTFFTKRGALRAAKRFEEWMRLHPSEVKNLPRPRHRVI